MLTATSHVNYKNAAASRIVRRCLIMLLSILLSYTPAHAMCLGSLTVYAASDTICAHTHFLVEGSYGQEGVILQLNKKHPIYLASATDTVPLDVLEILECQMSQIQALVKPSKAVQVGHTYRVVIEGVQRVSVRNISTGKPPPGFYVQQPTDTTAPILSSAIQYLKRTYQPFGCGPAEYIVFAIRAEDPNACLVKTTVTDLYTGQIHTAYVLPFNNQLRVGHGMCSGEFAFKKGHRYTVHFQVMDFCGNTLPKSKAYRCKAPHPKKDAVYTF
jgi:hypothetical protein